MTDAIDGVVARESGGARTSRTSEGARVREDLSHLTDHELRWALRESIARMYELLGIEDNEEEE